MLADRFFAIMGAHFRLPALLAGGPDPLVVADGCAPALLAVTALDTHNSNIAGREGSGEKQASRQTERNREKHVARTSR